MKKEIPTAVIVSAAVLVVILIVGAFVFALRPEPIPTGKIDTSLPPPQPKAGGKFSAKADSSGGGQIAPAKPMESTEKRVIGM